MSLSLGSSPVRFIAGTGGVAAEESTWPNNNFQNTQKRLHSWPKNKKHHPNSNFMRFFAFFRVPVFARLLYWVMDSLSYLMREYSRTRTQSFFSDDILSDDSEFEILRMKRFEWWLTPALVWNSCAKACKVCLIDTLAFSSGA